MAIFRHVLFNTTVYDHNGEERFEIVTAYYGYDETGIIPGSWKTEVYDLWPDDYDDCTTELIRGNSHEEAQLHHLKCVMKYALS